MKQPEITKLWTEERRTADGWREKIDAFASEADRRALRGRLTVEEKLSELETHHAEAMRRLKTVGDEMSEGWEDVRGHLGKIWERMTGTAETLQQELTATPEEREESKSKDRTPAATG